MKLNATQNKVFVTLFVIGLAANLDKGIIGAIAPYIMNDSYMKGLGFSGALTEPQVGNLTTFFYVTFIVMTFVAGWFVDKFGYKIFIPIALVLLVVGEAISGVAGLIGGGAIAILLLIARMIVGFGQAGYTNGTPPVIARNFAPEVRGAIQGRVVATAGIGTILVYLVFEPFVVKSNFINAFWILAALMVVCVLMFIFLVPGNPKSADAGTAKEAAAAPKKDVKIWEAWLNRNALVLAGTLLLNNAVGVALLNWANAMYQKSFADLHLTWQITAVMVGYGVTLLIATWTAADIIRKFFAGKEKQFMLGMCVIGAIFLVGTVVLPLYIAGSAGFWASAVCLWLSSLAIMWAFGVILMLPYQSIPVRIIGSAFAVINIGAFVGGIVQGTGIGFLIKVTGGYVTPFIVMGVLLLVSGLLPFLMKNVSKEELAAG